MYEANRVQGSQVRENRSSTMPASAVNDLPVSTQSAHEDEHVLSCNDLHGLVCLEHYLPQ